MKSVTLSAVTVLFFALAGQAHAACITGSPDGSTLSIHSKPAADGPVIGGAGVGQCNVEVTDHCRPNGYCHVFMGTLSGWADMRYIDVASDEQPPKQFTYRVSGGDGSITMGGISQPAPVEQRGEVSFSPKGEVLMLTLPREFSSPPIKMHRIGSSSFEGAMKSWGGFPMKVQVIAERISDPRATLEFFANNAMIKMDLKLVLTRINKPRLTTRLAPAPSQNSAHSSNGQAGRAPARKPVMAPSPTRAPKRPPAVQVSGNGARNSTGNSTRNNAVNGGAGNASLCVPLNNAIGPILRERRGSPKRSSLMSVLRQLGIFDVANATERQCFEIAAELIAAGVLSQQEVDLRNSPYDGLGGPEPAYGGEDPNTMVKGGVELQPSEQDFVPVRRPAVQASTADQTPAACIALADQIIRIITDNRSGAVRSLQERLIATSMDSISSKTEQHCAFTSSELARKGLL